MTLASLKELQESFPFPYPSKYRVCVSPPDDGACKVDVHRVAEPNTGIVGTRYAKAVDAHEFANWVGGAKASTGREGHSRRHRQA
jgi:hypothetical protein